MSNHSNQVGGYETVTLFIGSVVSIWTVLQYGIAMGNSTSCLTIGGVCLPYILLLLTCIEVVGIFAAVVFSTMRQSYIGVMILPHAAIAVAVTVAISAVLRISVG